MIRITTTSGCADALIDRTVTMSLEETFSCDDKRMYYTFVINGCEFCRIPFIIFDEKGNYTFLNKSDLIEKFNRLRTHIHYSIKIGKDVRFVVDNNGEYEIFDERVLE